MEALSVIWTMKLAFTIARTHLLSRPKQTIVAMMGVTSGIGMFIAMLSLMTGLNDMTEDLAMTSSQIHIRNFLTYSGSITLLIVAGFGIYNTLNTTIYNKMKDIAIFKAMGFTDSDVKQIFMIQSLVIGLIGSIAGLGTGFGLSHLISLAPFNGDDILSIEYLPVTFKPTYYVTGIIFGVITTVVAGYMPSRKAARIDPIEVLRGV